jgi:hypothetical protein
MEKCWFPLNEAKDWKNAGFSLNDAIDWKNANISANEAKDWKNAGFSLNEAIDWKNAGFSPDDAKKFVESNVPLEDIKFFKKLRKIIFTSFYVIGITFIPLINPYARKDLYFFYFMAFVLTWFLLILLYFPFFQPIINWLIPKFYRNLSPESAKLFSIIFIVLLLFIFFLLLYLMMFNIR